jgi:cell division protein FtsL
MKMMKPQDLFTLIALSVVAEIWFSWLAAFAGDYKVAAYLAIIFTGIALAFISVFFHDELERKKQEIIDLEAKIKELEGALGRANQRTHFAPISLSEDTQD